MLKIAFFISGRLTGYKECLLNILKYLKKNYNILLFLSINSLQDDTAINILKPCLGYYEFKPFFYEKDWIDNRLKHGRNFLGPFNQLSMFYNDLNNFNLIEKYENDNNIKFDVICKIRPDMCFYNINQFVFIKDNDDNIILNNVNLQCTIRMFGNSPPLISDACCFGNKKSMKIYCDTYNWIKKKDIELEGFYDRTFESYLNENLFEFFYDNPFYNPDKRQLSYKEYENIMFNNSRNIKFRYLDWKYDLLKLDIRRNNDTVNQPVNGIKINETYYIWSSKIGGLINKDFQLQIENDFWFDFKFLGKQYIK